MDENYEKLAQAIIMRAVMDLRGAYRRLKRFPDDVSALADVGDIRRFFCSRYFNLLSSLDGSSLLQRIIDEMEDKE